MPPVRAPSSLSLGPRPLATTICAASTHRPRPRPRPHPRPAIRGPSGAHSNPLDPTHLSAAARRHGERLDTPALGPPSAGGWWPLPNSTTMVRPPICQATDFLSVILQADETQTHSHIEKKKFYHFCLG